MTAAITGGQALVSTLESHDVRHVFTLAGESFLPVLQALSKSTSIRTITNRLESEAGFAAIALASLTNTPGVVCVTRGPGATNVSIAVHTAQQSSLPLLVCIGQAPSHKTRYEMTQYIDYTQMFAGMAKQVFTPRTPQEIANMTVEAMALAIKGRPGPAILEMPVDVLEELQEVTIPNPKKLEILNPSVKDVGGAVGLINKAERFLIVAGERVAFEEATEALSMLASQCSAGVLTTMRQQDLISYDHPSHLGNLGLGQAEHVIQAWDEADVVMVLGHRMNQETTRAFDETLCRGKKLISVYPDETVEHSLYPADIAIKANVKETLQLLSEQTYTEHATRANWVKKLHQAQMEYMCFPEGKAVGKVDMAEIMNIVSSSVPEDTIIVTDAGNFSTWPQIIYPFKQPHTQLGPINGAMGYGVPAGVGAGLLNQDRPIIVFVGDGGFLMTGPSALATAIHENVPVKVIVCDNSYYGTIYMHHVQSGNKDDHGLSLTNPDFMRLTEAYPGIYTKEIKQTSKFKSAFKEALAHDGPALLHLKTDIRDIVAGKSLEER